MIGLRWRAYICFGFIVASAETAGACDELAGKLLATFVAPAIASLGCSELGRAGVDKSDHKLESVCYSSGGPTSSVQVVASLRCHTAPMAPCRARASGLPATSAKCLLPRSI